MLFFKYFTPLTWKLQEIIWLLDSRYTLIRKRAKKYLQWIIFYFVLTTIFSIADGECTKKNIDYDYQEISGRKTTLAFTYSVLWKEVKNGGDRWDAFLLRPNPDRHYYAHLNGFIVVLLVFGIISIILLKTFHKDNNNNEDKDFKVNKYSFIMIVDFLLTPGIGLWWYWWFYWVEVDQSRCV